MTPSARIAAAIELLEILENSDSSAKKTVSFFFRKRRYIGSKDRREISERIFKTIRHHSRLFWWTKCKSPRLDIIISLLLIDKLPMNQISELFDGSRYGPETLSNSEVDLIRSLTKQTINHDDMAEWQKCEIPEWLYPELKQKWAKTLKNESTALNKPAKLDIRVNTLKSNRTEVIELLKAEKISAELTPFSPIGLRIKNPINIYSNRTFKRGFFEVQDEGSQLISLLVGAKPNEKVVDLCAGGGGKTLAIAASMKDGGPLIACDTNAKRLEKLPPRAKRAGVSNLSCQILKSWNDPWITKSQNTCKRVLVDAPCSGTGVWRRSPLSKWKLSANELSKRISQQMEALRVAETLLDTGGNLIYSTCSLLQRENEDQIDRFLSEYKYFRLRSIGSIWESVFGFECPSPEPFLNLSPARHGTDGFFCAVLEKTK